MCGIAGFYDPARPSPGSTLTAMCDAIRHRGPDEDGYYIDNGCSIGMRRLSIIDLTTGKQPISNEDRTVWIVFNGEIYNFQPLQEELKSRGHRFKTRSDTETIVHLYEEWGVEGLKRLRGMFAFAIWDQNKRRLLLVRDRVGKKPLYYTVRGGTIYFGSELKCLRAAGLPLEIDREGLRWYFQMKHIPDPFTAYQGVSKLPAGGWLSFEANGRVEQGRYWKMPVPAEEPPAGLTRPQAIEKLRHLFDEAVRIRMIADVPLGAFLSGGIDSSLVVATMARQSSEPVRTFSIGFEEAAFNETKYARMVAEKYKTNHRELIVKPDSMGMVDRIVDSFDEPFADASAIPTYYVCRAAADHVKVALSGDGGDEFFNGYESFFEVARYNWWYKLPKQLRKPIALIADALPYSAYGKNYLYQVSRETSFGHYISQYAPYSLLNLIQKDWLPPADAAYLIQTLPDVYVGPGKSLLTETVFYDATEKLTGDILVKVDRMSMACSLEVRSPLLDHELVEFAFSLPHSWKQSGNRGKTILLDALGDRLPPALLTRPKMGFGVPLPIWFRTTLRDYIHDHLLSRDFLDRGIVSEPFLRELMSEHDRGRRDNAHFLWMLLMLAVWLRRYGGQAGPGEVPAEQYCRTSDGAGL